MGWKEAPRRIAGLALLAAAMGLGNSSAAPVDAEACLGCHSTKDVAPLVDPTVLEKSVHRRLNCVSCHRDVGEIPHPHKPGPVDCGLCHGSSGKGASLPDGRTALESYSLTVHGQAVSQGNTKAAHCKDCHGSHDVRPPSDPSSSVAHRNIPHTCGNCHAKEAAQFRDSVHGKALARGVREAPACTDCHGEHTIRPPSDKTSSVWRGAITKTCTTCHGSEKITAKFGIPADRVQSFQDSYHGLAARSGDLKVANCASCHGWHDVLPSSDPRSSVHPANLATTCGQCHPQAGAKLGQGRIHQSLAAGEDGNQLSSFLRLFYLILIPLVIGTLLLHNVLDLMRKALTPAPLPPMRVATSGDILTPAERLQHALLVGTFTILAASGFALKFPESWLARLFALCGGEQVRLLLHRGAALAFVAVGLIHLIYLMAKQRGRHQLREFLPAKRDISDLVGLLRFNLGLSKERPVLEHVSYIEKMEYWALLWGSGVMVATGAVLIFHNYALTHYPLWVINAARVVHFMEAILACLAILVWHFYWVIFDPDIYPMNWTWLTGRKKR
jgi:cytochrome b subunit of formate dehydrogenase